MKSTQTRARRPLAFALGLALLAPGLVMAQDAGTLTAEERYIINHHIVQTILMLEPRRLAARAAADPDAEDAAHRAVDAAKQALGERGPVWWTDGAPDLNRKMARNTAYAEWFVSVGG